MKISTIFLFLTLSSIGFLSLSMEQPELGSANEKISEIKELKQKIKRKLKNYKTYQKIINDKYPLKKLKSILNKFTLKNLSECEEKEILDYALGILNQSIDQNFLDDALINQIQVLEAAPSISTVYSINNVLLRGANPNISPFKGGLTPLMVVSTLQGLGNERYILMQNLLDFGADVNARDNLGMTALMYAAKFNNKPIVEFLLRHGADKGRINLLNKTASEIALEEGNEELAKLIENYS